jgi:hypothetical protein
MTSRSASKRLQQRGFSQHGRIRRALLSILGTLLLGVGLYGLAGFYGGPWLVDRWLAQYRDGAPSRTTARERIRFNPFTLVGEIDALEIQDDATGARLAVDSLRVTLAANSLTQLRPVAHSMVVANPRIEIASGSDLSALGRLARSEPLARLRIDHLELSGGRLAIGRGTDRPIEWVSFDLSLMNFDGRSGTDASFRLEAVTAQDTTLTGDGLLAADLDHANGRLRLNSIRSETVAARLGGIIGAGKPRGRFDLAGEFVATSLLTAPTLELSDAALDLSVLSWTPAAGITATSNPAAAVASLVLRAADSGIAISGRAEIGSLRLSIDDSRVTPRQAFVFDDAALFATGNADTGEFSLGLGGRLSGAGEATISIRVPPGGSSGRAVAIEAAQLPAAMLSPYALVAVGRPLAAGDADLGVDYSLNGNRVAGSLHIVGREFAFAPQLAEETATSVEPPLELAAALLENSDHVIELDLPFASNAGTVRAAARAALQARIINLTANSFDALAPLLDGAAETVSAVPFLPGDAALGDRALDAIRQLAQALQARPRLGMRIHGGYEPTIDRDALAKQQIELHVQLATAGPSAQSRPAPVDFGSPRARDALDEFAGERLPAERVAELHERFDCEGALVPVCERAYYEQIFDALVANEEITPRALTRLGRFRALSVIDALRQDGIADGRLELVTDSAVVETLFGVGLPVELTVADAEPQRRIQ